MYNYLDLGQEVPHNYLITFTDETSGIYTFTLAQLESFVTLNAAYIVSVQDLGPVEPLPVYTCPYCGATFSTPALLDDHIQSQHPAPPPYVPCFIQIVSDFEASAGEEMLYQVGIQNKNNVGYYYKVEIWAPDQTPENKVVTDVNRWIGAGQWHSYSRSFIMPNKDAEIFVWVEVWRNDEWNYDNSALKTITLTKPEYAGTISRKELEYDHVRSSIPVY